jgi:hypothetical protein
VGGDFVLYGLKELHTTMKQSVRVPSREVDMSDRNELVGSADKAPAAFIADGDGSGLAESARLCAANRAEQLASLLADLTAGELITKDDVALAHRRADEAHIRTRRAYLAAAERHRRAAQAHERAAQVHYRAAAQGIGDIEAHRRAAASHRAARDNDYRTADEALRLAEAE